MGLVNTKEMFEKASKGKYAIGAFNIDNMDAAVAIIDAAKKTRSSVIIAVSEGARKFMRPGYIRPVIETIANVEGIDVALHLDHGKNFESCKACIDEGFTSVMIDASHLPLEENIKVTKEVVEYAHARGVTVEAELGAIAGIEDDLVVEDKYGHFTHPEDAVRFVKETGIDSLAIAIGTAHGAHKFKPGQKPQLRFDILAEITEKLPGFPLVLHGASSVPAEAVALLNQFGGNMKETVGIPEEMLREAAAKGITKINVGTDIRVAYVGALRKALAEKPDKFALPEFITPAKEAITKLVEHKIKNILGSENSL
jgi:fructose-bisphosphate aldolase class II